MIQQAANSQICLLFGEQVHENCPFHLKVDFILFSDKMKNIKFNIAEYLSTDVPNNSILFQFNTNDDAEDIVALIQKINTDAGIKTYINQKGLQIKFVGKNDKLFFLMKGQDLLQFMSQLGKALQKEQTSSNQIKILSLDIKSMLNLKHIKDTIQKIDVFTGLLESLQANLTFINSPTTKQLIKNFLEKTSNSNQTLKLFELFDHFNLKVKCDSGTALHNYSKLCKPVQVPLKSNYSDLAGKFKKDVKCYLFGENLSLNGAGKIERIDILLDLLLS